MSAELSKRSGNSRKERSWLPRQPRRAGRPAFQKIKAAVTDVGGVMCHAAIVCREYGLPAVVGTGSATSRLKTGQRIKVDGSTGEIDILS